MLARCLTSSILLWATQLEKVTPLAQAWVLETESGWKRGTPFPAHKTSGGFHRLSLLLSASQILWMMGGPWGKRKNLGPEWLRRVDHIAIFSKIPSCTCLRPKTILLVIRSIFPYIRPSILAVSHRSIDHRAFGGWGLGRKSPDSTDSLCDIRPSPSHSLASSHKTRRPFYITH